MASLFGLDLGFSHPKCAQCGMKLDEQVYEWNDKKFCCLDCKTSFRRNRGKGGGSCH